MGKKKSIDEKIDDLAVAVGHGFDEQRQERREMEGRLIERLDRIESKVTGLAGRVDVLEDVVRMVRTKLSI
jgi:hypothetical protein